MSYTPKDPDSFSQSFLVEGTEDSILGAGYITRSSEADLFLNETNHYYRCSVVLEGQGMLIDEDLNTYPLSPVCIYQCFPGKAYSLHVDFSQPWKEYQVRIGAPAFASLAAVSMLHTQEAVFPVQLLPHITQWMPMLAEQVRSMPQELYSENFFNLQKFLMALHEQYTPPAYSPIYPMIQSAKLLIGNDLDKEFSVQELARSFHMSADRFRKLFTQYVGMSPMQYRQYEKFFTAEKLLTEGMSLKEVAARLGYGDQFAFSRQFKKRMGISPSQFIRK